MSSDKWVEGEGVTMPHLTGVKGYHIYSERSVGIFPPVGAATQNSGNTCCISESVPTGNTVHGLTHLGTIYWESFCEIFWII